MLKEKKNRIKTIFKFVFIGSLLYYLFWLIECINYSINGISSEYVGIHIESLCDHIHTTYYGVEGFKAGIENFMIYTIFIYWFIPLYQIIYAIVCIIKHIINKNKIKKDRKRLESNSYKEKIGGSNFER